MKNIVLTFLLLIVCSVLSAQEIDEESKFYIGVSIGTSFSIGDFADTDVNNFESGFAKDGQKIDLFGGMVLNDKIVLIGQFRYESFETDVEEAINQYNALNQATTFTGSADNWQTHYFLLGLAYKIKISQKFALYPRFGVGPLWATNPGVTINSMDPNSNQNFRRSSETGFGFGYDIGIGLRRDFGRRISLMPAFLFSGGSVNTNVETTINNINVVRNYKPRIQSFTLGLSVAYRFY